MFCKSSENKIVQFFLILLQYREILAAKAVTL